MEPVSQTMFLLCFGGICSLMLFVWKNMISTIEKIDLKIDGFESRTNARFTLLQETITDIDRRLCRIEGMISAKECCMLKDHSHKKESA